MMPFRKIILFVVDISSGIASLYFAYLLRYGGAIAHYDQEVFIGLIPYVVVCRGISFTYLRLYSRFWEYASLDDLFQIVKAIALGSLLIMSSTFLYNRAELIPRSILIVDFVTLTIMIGGSRLFWRMWRERIKKQIGQENELTNRALIVGAGDTGAFLLKHIQRFLSPYEIIGFVDDNPSKMGQSLMGIKVMGGRHDLPTLISQYHIQTILIADETIKLESLREIEAICKKNNVEHRLVESVFDVSSKSIHVSGFKKIEPSDLLNRERISLDLSSLHKMIQGKRVLVTGAGGSIGSELCRHVLDFEPSSLVMVDIGENYLHELLVKLTPSLDGKLTQPHYCFASVTNEKKMEGIFSEHKPHLVFHAAAYKHVPIMEKNVKDAVINNVYGTILTADLAEKYGSEKFVLVSTDKVVNPSSVMGSTKKIAEQYVRFISASAKTQFMVVRFGNVLGSNGSVVPIFQKQINDGGPVTVTHPEMERYFILIPEAVQLILQASAIGRGGEIFLLEMGKPVKIKDLAEKMIRFSGFSLGRDIEIKYTGIRPGEKLFEELVDKDEEVLETDHNKIMLLKSTQVLSQDFLEKIKGLYGGAENAQEEDLKKMMLELISSSFGETVG